MKTQRAAVIGHPIRHTMSPFIHQKLFQLSGIPMEYQVLDIENLSEEIRQLKKLDVFNVTIPYKEKIIPYLDELDDKAKLFGSVNTVQVKDGKMKGYITDGTGCLQAIESAGVNLNQRILILGNGGTARAVAFEIAYNYSDFDITLAHRNGSAEKAKKIADEIFSFTKNQERNGGTITCLSYKELPENGEYEVLINATNVGMYPNTEDSPVDSSVLRNCRAVFDAVFNPEETLLLKTAKQMGIPIIKGIGMLVRQAAAAHACWYQTTFTKRDIEQLCEDATKEMNRIFYHK